MSHVPPANDLAPPRHRVLYIEDNAANLNLVAALLGRRSDVEFLSATAGYPGIALARVSMPDVILMDINLPDICGVAILNILRDDPATCHIPLIALSSDAFPRQIEKGLEAGFFRYMTKPFLLTELTRQLNETLAHVATRSLNGTPMHSL
jgi:CheY-like chemotaxis protein